MSDPRTEASDWAADKRGHYRDQHQPEESDPDLLMEEGHNKSTRIVVSKNFDGNGIIYYK